MKIAIKRKSIINVITNVVFNLLMMKVEKSDSSRLTILVRQIMQK